MCGILGTLAPSNTNNETKFLKSLQLLHHRGPDEQGFESFSIGNNDFLMGHKRLSIVDIDGGHQPMCDHRKRLWINFNGEIYNHVELRSQLSEKYSFSTDHSDTEVILYAYLEFGNRCFALFDGMFAIAIYDSSNKEIVLARDRFGIKPLYYFEDDSLFCFASELKAILNIGNDKIHIDEDNVKLYWINSNIPAPYTAYKNIYKLMPGEILRYNILQKILKKETYYKYCREPEIVDFDEAYLNVQKALTKAVKLYSRADVEISTFLSGGIDSGLVTALLAEQDSVKTVFHVPSKHNHKDTKDARKLAQIYDLNLIEIDRIFQYEFEEVLTIFQHMDEPFMDTSLIPTYLISNAVKQYGYKVVLTGDCNDEISAGYDFYSNFYFTWKYQNSLFAKMVKLLNKIDSKNRLNIPICFDNRDIIQLYQSRHYHNQFLKLFSNDKSYSKELSTLPRKGVLPIDYILEDTVNNYMTNDILHKVDMASMMCSVETRIPFLSNYVTDSLCKISASTLLKRGGKSLQKKMLYKMTKGQIDVYRRKAGFSINYDYIMDSSEVWSFINKVLADCPLIDLKYSETLRSQYQINKKGIGNYIDGDSITAKKIWRLLIFLIWWNAKGKYYA